MFSINANVMYSIDEKGQHSLEISYSDSDGADVGVYSKGDSFEKVVFDAADQMDEAMAAYDDDKADVEEAASIDKEIAKLQAQITELQGRSNELKKRHAEKINKKVASDEDLKKILDALKETDLNSKKKITIPFTDYKWWV